MTNLTFGSPLSVSASKTGAKTVAMTIAISESTIHVACNIEDYQPSQDYFTLQVLANDLARSCVALAAVSCGHGLYADLHTVLEPDAFPKLMLMQNKAVAAEFTAYKFLGSTTEENETFLQVAHLVIADPWLSEALHEFNQLLSWQEIAPINCGRILDSLRKMVAPDLKPVQGWPILQGVLNSDERFMKWISDQSTDPRHGDRSELNENAVAEVAQRTAIILNRFLEYRKRGGVPLPIADFPLLIG